jgi:hypothetical protein
MTDLSDRLRLARQAQQVLGAYDASYPPDILLPAGELVANPSFTTDLSGWSAATWTWAAGDAVSTGQEAALQQQLTLVPGAKYRLVASMDPHPDGIFVFGGQGIPLGEIDTTVTAPETATALIAVNPPMGAVIHVRSISLYGPQPAPIAATVQTESPDEESPPEPEDEPIADEPERDEPEADELAEEPDDDDEPQDLF